MYVSLHCWVDPTSFSVLWCFQRDGEREREEKQILFTAKSLTPKHQRQREGERERGETDVRREGYALYPGNDGGERERRDGERQRDGEVREGGGRGRAASQPVEGERGARGSGGHCEQAERREGGGEDSERGMGRLPDQRERSVTTELLPLLEDELGAEDNAPYFRVQRHAGHLVISCSGGGCGGGGGSLLLQQ